MDKGRAGRGGTEWDGTNVGGDRNAGRYGGEAGATDGCDLYHFLVLSALLLIIFLSDCLFSTEHADR